jgi:hypothetical protein
MACSSSDTLALAQAWVNADSKTSMGDATAVGCAPHTVFSSSDASTVQRGVSPHQSVFPSTETPPTAVEKPQELSDGVKILRKIRIVTHRTKDLTPSRSSGKDVQPQRSRRGRREMRYTPCRVGSQPTRSIYAALSSPHRQPFNSYNKM